MDLLRVLFLTLPIFLSGLTFIVILKIGLGKKFAYPLDAGFVWKGKRLFGDNKTIRGPVIMGVFTMVYGFVIYYLLKVQLDFNLDNQRVLVYFLVVGLVYSLAELPNSFLKRRLSISPGETAGKGIKRYGFRLLDIFDSLFGCALVYIFFFHFSCETVLVAVILGSLLHISTDRIMRLLGLK